jgi:3-dehydroquinate dehydratase type I
VTPRICVSILPKTTSEALNNIDRAEKAQTNFVEVRLDQLEACANLHDLAHSTKIPLIATNKLLSERGYFAGTETERQLILISAAKSGFEYVDLDLANPVLNEAVKTLKVLGAKPILSFHKFDGALSISEMELVAKQEIALGANICKIITTARKMDDNLRALNFVSKMSSKLQIVCFCMGELGRVSRLLSPMFGAFFTFASLEHGGETASGQMTIEEMKTAYELLERN